MANANTLSGAATITGLPNLSENLRINHHTYLTDKVTTMLDEKLNDEKLRENSTFAEKNAKLWTEWNTQVITPLTTYAAKSLVGRVIQPNRYDPPEFCFGVDFDIPIENKTREDVFPFRLELIVPYASKSIVKDDGYLRSFKKIDFSNYPKNQNDRYIVEAMARKTQINDIRERSLFRHFEVANNQTKDIMIERAEEMRTEEIFKLDVAAVQYAIFISGRSRYYGHDDEIDTESILHRGQIDKPGEPGYLARNFVPYFREYKFSLGNVVSRCTTLELEGILDSEANQKATLTKVLKDVKKETIELRKQDKLVETQNSKILDLILTSTAFQELITA